MTLVVLIPGAGSDPAYWDDLRAELTARGLRSTAVDLPREDGTAGLDRYAVVEAIGGQGDAVLAAHAFGEFTAPLVCARAPVRRIVLVSAMIPLPGESGNDWWADLTRSPHPGSALAVRWRTCWRA